MQSTTTPQKPSYNFKRLAWIAAAATLTACCCIGFVVFRSGNDSAPPPVEGETDLPASTAGPPATATVAALGKTRDAPHPKGTTIEISGGMQATILDVTRPADAIVEQGNMFNDTPVPGAQEYLLVRLRVECIQSSNEKCSFNPYEFKTVGADGQVHDPAPVAGVPEAIEPFTEFFGGAALEGNLVFLVPAGDPSVVLFYEPLIFGDPIYLALE